MTAESGTAKPRAGGGVPPFVFILIGLALAGGAAFWYLEHQSRGYTPPMAVLTPEGKTYAKRLQLSDVAMKATDTYVKQRLVEIVGKITNAGDRRLKSVDLNCVFYDYYGQVVLRERVSIVRSRMGGLNPGETKDFRLPFDTIPESWNQAMPQLVIAQVLFE